MPWRPSASLSALRARARLLASVRVFFADRNVLEVETPALCQAGVTDPSIEPLVVSAGVSVGAPRYLQSSPEYAMKRLLAAGSGPIYQVSRVFRDGEAGARHNPEFTLLEWYRPELDHHSLMDEVSQLVKNILGDLREQRVSYRDLFHQYLSIDPFVASDEELVALANERLDVGALSGDRDLWLDLLLSHCIEPQLAERGGLTFVFDYPASQAALARIEEDREGLVARRFELYVDGVELANGYLELTDPQEQRKRFTADNARREASGQQTRPLDEHLLAAMAEGLPPCSGVALGIDRLLMLAQGASSVSEVIAFDWSSA